MRQRFYILVRCKVGRAGRVAAAIKALSLPFYAEVAMVSGEWDVIVRAEPDSDREIGPLLVEPIRALDDCLMTRTEIAYPIYDPDDIAF